MLFHALNAASFSSCLFPGSGGRDSFGLLFRSRKTHAQLGYGLLIDLANLIPLSHCACVNQCVGCCCHFPMKQLQEDGTLVIHQTSVFDRGTYTCRSTSPDTSSVSVVTVPVIIIAYPPRITTGPSPVTYTRPGVAVELPCLTIATPRAMVTWETPDMTQLRVLGQARIYGNRYLSPRGSLVIQKPSSRDTGFYRCTAKNVIGVDTKTTYLHVI